MQVSVSSAARLTHVLHTQTIVEADLAGDGHISPAEWQALVRASPDIINYMTLPVLQQVTTKYPSFLFDPF